MDRLLKKLTIVVRNLEKEFDQIPENRKHLLEDLITYIKGQSGEKDIRLTFICTHNSRRSHIAQVWTQLAAYHFGIKGVKAFSGGTEITAFHPNSVKALETVGFRIKKRSSGGNPVYAVYFSDIEKPVQNYSKLYNISSNPQSDFVAVMTCSDANEACPMVQGANFRIPVTYEDPKVYDNTPVQDQKYLERVLEIGREMLYVFSNV